MTILLQGSDTVPLHLFRLLSSRPERSVVEGSAVSAAVMRLSSSAKRLNLDKSDFQPSLRDLRGVFPQPVKPLKKAGPGDTAKEAAEQPWLKSA
jgi:hypothetical protein